MHRSLFLVTREAWEHFEILINRVDDLYSIPLLSLVFDYTLLAFYKSLISLYYH